MNEQSPGQDSTRTSDATATIDAAVTARGVTKTYAATNKTAAVEALKSVDLTIPVGSFFGLLGPNGAGKSTFINILAGLVTKTAGSVAVWGHDIDSQTRQARAAIGVVPQELNLDPFFTPAETTEFQAGLYGVPKAERRTAERRVAPDRPSRRLCPAPVGGHAQAAAAGKSHGPLTADSGSGRAHRRGRRWSFAISFGHYIRQLNAGGATVLLTTHYLEEAEALCDHMAIIHNGQVIVHEPTAQLVAKLDRKMVIIALGEAQNEIPEPLAQFDVELTGPHTLTVRVRTQSDRGAGQVLDAVRQAGWTIADLTTEQSDLEEVFLALTAGHRPTPRHRQFMHTARFFRPPHRNWECG